MPKQIKTQTLLIVPGQFIVLTASDVFVALLTAEQNASYWDAIAICDDTRAPEVYRLEVYRRVFGRDAIQALPASKLEALLAYAEHWDGLHKDLVRGIAACILTGTPFSRDGDGKDGGTREPLPKSPKTPHGGGARKRLPVAT